MREEFVEEAQAWATQNPRLWWAWEQLADEDDLQDRILSGIMKNDMSPVALQELERFAAALETRDKAKSAGSYHAPPKRGLRRPIPVRVLRLTKVNWRRSKTFRVDFKTDQGWSGFFDTQNPRLVEQVTKTQGAQITVIGEVESYLYDFLVVLGSVRVL